MPATKGERWLNRLLAVLSNTASAKGASLKDLEGRLTSGNIYDELFQIFSALPYEKIEPLYNELLECCEHIPEKNNPNFSTPCNQENIDSIVGEVGTLYRLRFEALKVNFAFFQKGLNAQPQKEPSITFKKPIRM